MSAQDERMNGVQPWETGKGKRKIGKWDQRTRCPLESFWEDLEKTSWWIHLGYCIHAGILIQADVFRVSTSPLQLQATFPLSWCVFMACGPMAFIRFPGGSPTWKKVKTTALKTSDHQRLTLPHLWCFAHRGGFEAEKGILKGFHVKAGGPRLFWWGAIFDFSEASWKWA